MLPKIRKLLISEKVHDGPEQNTETIATLIGGNSFRLELIHSYSDCSPDKFWYDQEQEEWVTLIAGKSVLEFEEGFLSLEAGDAILIPSHLKHRVVSTSNDATWLALHFSN